MSRSFYLDTTTGIDLITITHEIRGMIKESKAERGSVTVTIPHEGGGVAMMESGGKKEEVRKGLEPLAANLSLRCLLPKSLTIPVEQGRMVMEPWQEISLIDYETTGRRREFKAQLFWEQKESGESKK